MKSLVRRLGRRRFKLLVALPLLVWTAFALLPFILIGLSSLRNSLELSEYPFGTGGAYHFSNYVQAWKGPYGSVGMSTFLVNSVEALLSALVLNLVVGATAAYFITGLRRRAQMIAMRFFLLGTVIPVVLILIPYYQAYQALNALNSPVELGIAYGVQGLPVTVLVLNAFFKDFPRELREAAAIDGVGPLQTFVRIVIPVAKGAIVAAALLLILFVWNETQLAIVFLQAPSSQTVSVGVLGFEGRFTTDYGPLFAGLSIAMMPVLVLYALFSKHITRGVELGGVTK